MDKKDKTACFTGHREYDLPSFEVKNRLRKLLDSLIAKNIFYYGCGGALGFDLLAAEIVIEKKKVNPKVKLIMVLPCKGHDRWWSPEQQAAYAYIKMYADKIVYTSETYSRGCMHKRNRHLVDCSSYCIALLEKSHGGTYYTINYALQRGLEIYNLADSNWDYRIKI